VGKKHYSYRGAVIACCLVMGCGNPSMEEAQAYHDLIKDKHAVLGYALITHGQLLERHAIDSKAIDTDAFKAREDVLYDYLEALGSVEELKGLVLPSESLMPLHESLVESVHYLKESVRVVDEGAYTMRASFDAEILWEESRTAYLDFTGRILSLTGREEDVLAPVDRTPPEAGKVFIPSSP